MIGATKKSSCMICTALFTSADDKESACLWECRLFTKWMILSSILLLKLLVGPRKKSLLVPFLQYQLEMQLWRLFKMQHLTLSKSIDVASMCLGILIKSFLKKLFLIIRRSLVTICLWCLSVKGVVDYLGLPKIDPNLDYWQTYRNWNKKRSEL